MRNSENESTMERITKMENKRRYVAESGTYKGCVESYMEIQYLVNIFMN